MSAHQESDPEEGQPAVETIQTQGKVFMRRELCLGVTADLEVIKYRLIIGETLLNVIYDSIHRIICNKDPMIKLNFEENLQKARDIHPELDLTDSEVKAEHEVVVKFISGLIEKFEFLSQWQEVGSLESRL